MRKQCFGSSHELLLKKVDNVNFGSLRLSIVFAAIDSGLGPLALWRM